MARFEPARKGRGVPMFYSNRKTLTLRASVTIVLCTALVSTGAMAAPPLLRTVAVTPAAATISVGRKQTFTATGTFSDGSTHVLGPDFSNIALGSAETCALQTNGGVECWGLSRGGPTSWLVPQPIKGVTNATALAHGDYHACAALANGSVQCWGENGLGQLGQLDNSSTFATVTGISTATAVAAGQAHSCALLADGSIQCWGANVNGEVGSGSPDYRTLPMAVAGITTAAAVAAGGEHSCASLADGRVQCWGANYDGEVGDGSGTVIIPTPAFAVGISTAIAVVAGYEHSCALLATGTVQCWGHNQSGQLGNLCANGSNLTCAVPAPVTGISTAIAITAGGWHTCALLRGGAVKCWGNNEFGQLGNGGTTNSNVPVTVRMVNAPTRLAAGFRHTCALFAGGAIRCWGLDKDGELGNRRRTVYRPNPLPVNVIGTPGVLWTSSDSSKAIITGRGLAIARAVGNTTITATTAGFINDNAVLTVK